MNLNQEQLLKRGILFLILGPCLYGQSYESIYSNARTLLGGNKYTEALSEARKAIALDGSRWEAYFVTATAYVGLENCDAAIPYFDMATSRGVPDQLKTVIASSVADCTRTLDIPKAVQPALDISTANPAKVPSNATGQVNPQPPAVRRRGSSGLYIAQKDTPMAVLHSHSTGLSSAALISGILTIGSVVTFEETGSGNPDFDRKYKPNPAHSVSAPRNEVIFEKYFSYDNSIRIRIAGTKLTLIGNDTEMKEIGNLLTGH